MTTRRPISALALLVAVALLACARAEQKELPAPEKKSDATLLPVTGPSTSGLLDGRTFAGKLVENGKESPGVDNLIFADGTFRSKECDQYGFTAAPYRTSVSGDAVTFDAVCTSAKEGKMTWHGVMQGDTLTGTALWEKQGQASIEYSYVATTSK